MHSQPHRRWFRPAFTLRMLFVVVTICGVWLGWNLYLVRRREAALKYLSAASVVIPASEAMPLKPWRSLPLGWEWLGAKPILKIEVFKRHQSDRDVAELERLFPEASIIVE